MWSDSFPEAQTNPALLGFSLAMVVVTLAQPVANSLAYASSFLVLISMIGWVLEAREVAGPAPAVEPEHEEEEEAPGPSYWPVVLAVGDRRHRRRPGLRLGVPAR